MIDSNESRLSLSAECSKRSDIYTGRYVSALPSVKLNGCSVVGVRFNNIIKLEMR